MTRGASRSANRAHLDDVRPQGAPIDIPGHGKGKLLEAMHKGRPKLAVETLKWFCC